MTKQTIKRWDARLQNSTWTRSDINAFSKLLNDLTNERRNKNIDPYKEATQLIFFKYCDATKKLTEDQTKFGIDWLKNYAFKKNGQPRQNKYNPLGIREREIIKNFSHFELVGFYDIGSNGWGHHRPIYRTYSKSGSYFEYIPGSYGNWDIEIVG